jgi:DNA-binding IclR family transcriptional regulator
MGAQSTTRVALCNHVAQTAAVACPSPQTDRVVALVELLAARPGEAFTLAEVTRRLGVNKSTCYSMLTSLTQAGWLLRDPARKTYRLGPALLAVSRAAGETFPALDFAHAAMVDLSLEVRANCAALGVSAEHVAVLDQVRDLRATGPGLRVGASIPLHPPFGTAVIAFSDPDAVDRWLAHVPAETHPRHRAGLDAVRDRGFAVEIATLPEAQLRDVVADLGDTVLELPQLVERLAHELAEREDFLPLELDATREYPVSTINAPVFDHDGRVTLVLSLNGFADRLTGAEVQSIGDRLTSATGELSAALGAPTRRPAAR